MQTHALRETNGWVFRRHHAGNNPLRRIDPRGLKWVTLLTVDESFIDIDIMAHIMGEGVSDFAMSNLQTDTVTVVGEVDDTCKLTNVKCTRARGRFQFAALGIAMFQAITTEYQYSSDDQCTDCRPRNVRHAVTRHDFANHPGSRDDSGSLMLMECAR